MNSKSKKADQRVVKNSKQNADQRIILIAKNCELLILLENSVQSIIMPVKNKINIRNIDIFRSKDALEKKTRKRTRVFAKTQKTQLHLRKITQVAYGKRLKNADVRAFLREKRA